MHRKIKAAVVSAGLFVAATTAARADVIAEFANGNDSSAPVNANASQSPVPDSWLGAVGSGWASAWADSSAGTNNTQVLTANPLPNDSPYAPSGSVSTYLSINNTMNNSFTTTVRRVFSTSTASGGISVTQPYIESFEFRLDSSQASRKTADVIRMLSSNNGSGPSNTNQEWGIFSSGSSTQDFQLQSGDGAGTGGTVSVDTGLPLITGDVFLISVEVFPVTGTFNVNTNFPKWNATITDETANTTFTDVGLRFRDNFLYAGPDLQFSNTAGANAETITDSLGYLDITNSVPEPASATLLAIGGAFALKRRRRV